MTVFDSIHKRGTARLLVRDYGEEVTFFPGGVGSPRTIMAIVERDSFENPAGFSDGIAPHIVVKVMDNNGASTATDGLGGIGYDELSTGGSNPQTITLEVVKGSGTTEARNVIRRIPELSNGGILAIEIR